MLKRYGNRKLYDTGKSVCVTVPQIQDRVLNGEKVFCHKTGKDVTHSILATIILNNTEALTVEKVKNIL